MEEMMGFGVVVSEREDSVRDVDGKVVERLEWMTKDGL